MNAATLCSAEHSQVLLIDIQERLAGVMPTAALDGVVSAARLVVASAKHLDIPVHLTEQYPQGLGTTLAAIREHLPAGLQAITKTRFSAAHIPELQAALGTAAERQEILLLGMEAHICVFQTAIELSKQGHRVRIVEDGICSRHPEDQHAAIARLRHAGVDILTSEAVVFEWLRDAKHPAFKQVSQWVR